MLNSLESIDIRVGTEEDGPEIAKFAISLSEDSEISKEKWLKIIKQKNVYPILGIFENKIVGKVQARIVGNIGYLESARVTPNFRKRGLARTLIDTAMDWIISQDVKHIRSTVDSDNLPARLILERNKFICHFLAINPTARVSDNDASPLHTDEFTAILDDSFYNEFISPIKKMFVGNILVDGHFVPYTQDLFNKLIEEKRIFTNNDRNTLIVKSSHKLPSEFQACVISNSVEGYQKASLAVRAYSAQEMASIAICYAPSKRNAVEGLIHGKFGWSQPHSVIVYQRDPWPNK